MAWTPKVRWPLYVGAANNVVGVSLPTLCPHPSSIFSLQLILFRKSFFPFFF